MDDSTELIGKTILVGLTYLDKNDQVQERVERHGKITKLEKGVLVFEQADNKGEFSIPFDAEHIYPGQPGAIYTLKTTGEIVENVDLVSTWTIHKAKE